MAAHSLDPAVARQALDAVAAHGSIAAAARALGESRTTIQSRIKVAAERGVAALVEMPSFPEDDISAEDILDQMEARFVQRKAHADALHWFEIKVRDNLPLGINWFGDPHIGSNGCNLPLLRRDVAIVCKTPGMVAANIGDTVDNWGGRLIHLYTENDVSKPTERRLARWFLQEAGIPWLLWLFGNHDQMDGGFATYLQAINAKSIPMADWRARFVLVFPNGRRVRIDAAHNHKGHSQWNELHGQERASVFDEFAHLFIAGHHHNAALKVKEMPDGQVTTLARCRGYKWLDHFADVHGFHQKQGGASIVTVIDPTATNPWNIVRAFADAEEGADFLTYRRKRSS